MNHTEEFIFEPEEKPFKRIKSSTETYENTPTSTKTNNTTTLNSNKKASNNPQQQQQLSSANWKMLAQSDFHLSQSQNLDCLFSKSINSITGGKPNGSPQVNMIKEMSQSPERKGLISKNTR